MSDQVRTCSSCGARVPPDATQCTLCGTPVDPAAPEKTPDSPSPEETADESEGEPPRAEGEETDADRPVYCNQCGWENPGDARYCSQCGSELQDLSAGEAPAGTRTVQADLPSGPDETDEEEPASTAADPAAEAAPVGQQITLVVGAALLLVVGLFFATRWSQSDGSGATDGAQPGPSTSQATPQRGGSPPSAQGEAGTPSAPGSAGPATGGASEAAPSTDLRSLVDSLGQTLTGPLAAQADSLRRLVRNADESQKRQARAELANLLIGAGAPGRAALVQSRRADATETVEDRRRAADLLYKWMRQVQGQSDRQQVRQVARHVAQAYQAVAEQRPQDLDARTRMGEAYLLTNNPMRGIQAINAVLDQDSTFVPARFQKGLALLQINRLDQALQQFRQVKRDADSTQAFYQQAQRAIEVITKQLNKQGGPEGSAPSTP